MSLFSAGAARRGWLSYSRGLAAALTAACAAAFLFAAQAAVAKPYTQILCVDPVTRRAANTGMPDGMSYTGSNPIWLATGSCGANPTGVRFFPGYGQNVPPGFWAALMWRPAAKVNYRGGYIYRSLVTDSSDSYASLGINHHASDGISNVYAIPRTHSDAGDWYAGGMNRGTIFEPFSASNRVNLRADSEVNPANGFSITAACIPNGPPSCPVQNDRFIYSIYGGRIFLDDSDDPVSNNVSGSLVTSSVLKGTEDITVNARDEGSGLRSVQVQLDGNVVRTESMGDNDGRCVDFDPSTPELEYTNRVPCKLNASKHFELDTTQLPEGEHTVRVVVSDAAGNEDYVVTRNRLYVDNIPGVADPAGGSKALTLQEMIDRYGPMTNGSHSSINASIVVGFNKSMKKKRRIAGFKSVKTLYGKITNTDTKEGIGKALIDVHTQLPLKGAGEEEDTTVKTKEDGSFRLTLPARVSSRKLFFIYRPWLNQDHEATRSEVNLAVKAGISLKVHPRKSAFRKRISFRGKLLGGPFPTGGKQVVLQARSRGTGWLTFRVLRTKRNGTFRTSYRFKQRGRITYQFRVLSRYEAAYPYLLGTSPKITVVKQW